MEYIYIYILKNEEADNNANIQSDHNPLWAEIKIRIKAINKTCKKQTNIQHNKPNKKVQNGTQMRAKYSNSTKRYWRASSKKEYRQNKKG